MVKVLMFTILTFIVLIIFKSIRTFLYKYFGINIFISKDVECFKSKLSYIYLKIISFTMFYAWLIITLSLFYEYFLIKNNNLFGLFGSILIFPIINRIIIFVGINLYKKKY